MGVWGQISGMLILWGVGLGTEIIDVYILGGVVLCGGLGTDIGDVNGGGSDRGVLGQILGMLHDNS